MKTTMGSVGRVVTPRNIRERAGLKSGAHLDVSCNDGTIELSPSILPVRLERRGRALVAVPEAEVEVLTDEVVEQTRQDAHQERGDIG
jgi:AbrB family looped-hinge helix DNA binding protein